MAGKTENKVPERPKKGVAISYKELLIQSLQSRCGLLAGEFKIEFSDYRHSVSFRCPIPTEFIRARREEKSREVRATALITRINDAIAHVNDLTSKLIESYKEYPTHDLDFGSDIPRWIDRVVDRITNSISDKINDEIKDKIDSRLLNFYNSISVDINEAYLTQDKEKIDQIYQKKLSQIEELRKEIQDVIRTYWPDEKREGRVREADEIIGV